MPLDPRIPLGVQPIQIDTPMQTMAQVYQLRAMQDNQRYRQEQMELQRLQEQRLQEAASFALGQKQLDARAGAALAPNLRSTASGVAEGFDLDGWINSQPEELRDRLRTGAQEWQSKQAKIYNDMATGAKTQLESSRQQVQLEGEYAEELRASGYDQGTFRAILANIKRAVPSFDDEAVFNQYGHDPEKLKAYVDGKIEAAKEDYTLSRGDVRKGPTGGTVAQGLGPEPPKPERVTKYDPATGQTFEEYVTPTVGAKFLQPPPRVDPTLQAIREITLANAKAGRTPAEVSHFDTIAGQYQKSPLINARDRTIILSDAAKAARADPSNVTRQLALAYAFVQGVDTYNSSVREGELQNITSLTTRYQQLQIEANRLYNSSAFIPPELVKQLADTGDELVATIEKGAARKRAEFGARAHANGAGVGAMWDDFEKRMDAAAAPGQPAATHRWDPVAKKLVPVTP